MRRYNSSQVTSASSIPFSEYAFFCKLIFHVILLLLIQNENGQNTPKRIHPWLILKVTYRPVTSYRPFSLGVCLPITDCVIFSGEKKNIHSYLRDYLKISQNYYHIGGSWNGGMALSSHQCDLGSLPRTHRHMRVEFVVRFSPGSPVFLPPQKPTLLNSNSFSYTCTL